MAGDDALEDAGEPGVRFEAVELRGSDERGEEVRAGEEGVLAGERDGADLALDDVGVELDAAVVEEQGEAVPQFQRKRAARPIGLGSSRLRLAA